MSAPSDVVFTLHEIEDGEGNGIVHWYCSPGCRDSETADYGEVEPCELSRAEVPDARCEACGVELGEEVTA
jgi:hypothetical protein